MKTQPQRGDMTGARSPAGRRQVCAVATSSGGHGGGEKWVPTARSRGPACRGRGCPERFREQSRVEGAPLAHTGTAGLGAGLPGPGQPQRSPRSPLEPLKLAALPAPSPVTPPGSPSSPGCSPPQAPWPPQHDRPARPRPRCLSSRSHFTANAVPGATVRPWAFDPEGSTLSGPPRLGGRAAASL